MFYTGEYTLVGYPTFAKCVACEFYAGEYAWCNLLCKMCGMRVLCWWVYRGEVPYTAECVACEFYAGEYIQVRYPTLQNVWHASSMLVSIYRWGTLHCKMCGMRVLCWWVYTREVPYTAKCVVCSMLVSTRCVLYFSKCAVCSKTVSTRDARVQVMRTAWGASTAEWAWSTGWLLMTYGRSTCAGDPDVNTWELSKETTSSETRRGGLESRYDWRDTNLVSSTTLPKSCGQQWFVVNLTALTTAMICVCRVPETRVTILGAAVQTYPVAPGTTTLQHQHPLRGRYQPRPLRQHLQPPLQLARGQQRQQQRQQALCQLLGHPPPRQLQQRQPTLVSGQERQPRRCQEPQRQRRRRHHLHHHQDAAMIKLKRGEIMLAEPAWLSPCPMVSMRHLTCFSSPDPYTHLPGHSVPGMLFQQQPSSVTLASPSTHEASITTSWFKEQDSGSGVGGLTDWHTVGWKLMLGVYMTDWLTGWLDWRSICWLTEEQTGGYRLTWNIRLVCDAVCRDETPAEG